MALRVVGGSNLQCVSLTKINLSFDWGLRGPCKSGSKRTIYIHRCLIVRDHASERRLPVSDMKQLEDVNGAQRAALKNGAGRVIKSCLDLQCRGAPTIANDGR